MQSSFRKQLSISVLTAALIFAFIGFPGCEKESEDIPTGPATTVEGLVEDGWAMYVQGSFQEAVTCFNNAANAEAQNLEAYLGMGYAFAQLNELTRSLQNFDNVIGLCPVLIETGEISEEDANKLRAESYAGMASAYLADREYTNAIENANTVLEMDENFEHRWIEGFDDTQVTLIKAEAYFGGNYFADCMFLLDEITGNFIAQSAQVRDTTENIMVIQQQDTWTEGISMLELSLENLIYPSVIYDLNLLEESLMNPVFTFWTDGMPDDWTVVNYTTDDTTRIVEEVGSGETYGGTGLGACHIHNAEGSGAILSLSQDNIPTNTQVLVDVDVSLFGGGMLKVYYGETLLGSIDFNGLYSFDFLTTGETRLTLEAVEGTSMTVDKISCRETEQGFAQEIVSYISEGKYVSFRSNPIAQPGSWYTITYYYALNFGMFETEMRGKIDELRL